MQVAGKKGGTFPCKEGGVGGGMCEWCVKKFPGKCGEKLSSRVMKKLLGQRGKGVKFSDRGGNARNQSGGEKRVAKYLKRGEGMNC